MSSQFQGMRQVFCDTSFFYACLDPTDKFCSRARCSPLRRHRLELFYHQPGM